MAEKAEGVFLWVNLAVKELKECLRNEDSRHELEERLRSLPEEIEGIYGKMLSRVIPMYHKDAAMYFQLIHIEEMTLLGINFAKRQALGRGAMKYAAGLKPGDLTKECCTMRTQLLARCAGLLECDDPPPLTQISAGPASENASTLELPKTLPHDINLCSEEARLFLGISVRFIHRTARDFIFETGPGLAFMKNISNPAFNPYLWHFWAHISSLLFPVISWRRGGIVIHSVCI